MALFTIIWLLLITNDYSNRPLYDIRNWRCSMHHRRSLTSILIVYCIKYFKKYFWNTQINHTPRSANCEWSPPLVYIFKCTFFRQKAKGKAKREPWQLAFRAAILFCIGTLKNCFGLGWFTLPYLWMKSFNGQWEWNEKNNCQRRINEAI